MENKLLTSKLMLFANLTKKVGWLLLIFYSLKSLMEFLEIIVDLKFQSDVIRGDWYALLDVSTYLLDFIFRGWVYWLLLSGISIGLTILSETHSIKNKKNSKTIPGLYKAEDILWTSAWLERMSLISIAAIVFKSIPSIIQLKGTIFSFNLVSDALSWGVLLVSSGGILILDVGLIYLTLKGFAQVLKILLEIRSNS